MNFWFGDSANVIHVSKSGNDSNGGAAQQYPVNFANDAKLTIGSAVTACPDGGTIIVWPGDYDETVDIETAEKQITLIGTHPRLSCIKPTTGKGVVGYHGLTLKNISVEVQDDASQAVDCQGMDDLSFFNCYIHTRGMDGLYFGGCNKAVVDNCFVFAGYDGIYAGEDTTITNSTVITDGCYGTTGVARAICAANWYDRVLIRNSVIMAQAKYGDEKIGKSAALYECERDLIAIDNCIATLENCSVWADGSLPTLPHASSFCSGNAYCIQGAQFIAKNTRFYAYTDANQSSTVGYAIVVGTNCIVNSCSIDANGTSAAYDFYAAGAKTIKLLNCAYDTSQVHSNVTVRGVDKAAQVITNKAIQNKSTGVIDYYDDSGSSVILTHTPTDTESTITRTPG